jgi:serine/threonine protein kinase
MGIDPFAKTIAATSLGGRLSRGDVVADRYRVEQLLGEGAMGVVYRVEHTQLHKFFALKVLAREWADAPDAFARFEREAIAAGKIAHPHIAQATDFGRLPDGSCFLVLEYVDGRTLRSALKRGALAPDRALRISRGICSAVAAAHAAGVVHRDLKPENVMLVDRGGDTDYVKVLDFGIAKLQLPPDAKKASTELTRQGAVMGTPAYMSPEQAVGERVDARTDLYTIGVMLFEMLTGERPFRGDAQAMLRQHVVEPAPPLPDSVRRKVGDPFAEIVRRLLAKDPQARFASAVELGVALERLGTVPAPGPDRSPGKGPAPQPLAPSPDRGVRESSPKPAGSVGPPPGLVPRASRVSWRRRVGDYLRTRERRRRLRSLLEWPDALVGSIRTWRKRRRVDAAIAAAPVLAGQLRDRVAQTAARVAWKRLAGWLAFAVVFSCALAAVWWWAARDPEEPTVSDLPKQHKTHAASSASTPHSAMPPPKPSASHH